MILQKIYLQTSKTSVSPVTMDMTRYSNLAYHRLWTELHTNQAPTPEWFSDWLNRVPKSCGCDKSLQSILDELGTPDYTDWFSYSVRLHNAVNRKLGKPEIDLEAARAIYQ